MKKEVVIITDCADVAAVELFGTLKKLIKNPNVEIAPIVSVEKFSITNAAFLSRLLCDVFPPETIFFILCSPNKERHERIVVQTTKGHTFVAGNNGTLTWILDDFKIKVVRNVKRQSISPFGGRDAYCPILVQLLDEEKIEKIGEPFEINKLKRIVIQENTVVHIDNFGNPKIHSNPKIEKGIFYEVKHNGKSIGQAIVSERFMDLDTGTLTLYHGSSLGGLLEVAKVRQNLASEKNIRIGDKIEITKHKIKAVFFDLSGTLLKRSFLETIDLSAFLAKHHISLTPKEYSKIFNEIFLLRKNKDLPSALKELTSKIKPQNSAKFIWEEQEFINDLINKSELFEGTKQLLMNLKVKGFKIGLIANVDQFTIKILNKLGILSCFDYLIPSFEIGKMKPDLDIFNQAIQKSGLNPNEIIYVGDSEDKDIVPAQKAGMHTLLFTNNEALLKELTMYNIDL